MTEIMNAVIKTFKEIINMSYLSKSTKKELETFATKDNVKYDAKKIITTLIGTKNVTKEIKKNLKHFLDKYESINEKDTNIIKYSDDIDNDSKAIVDKYFDSVESNFEKYALHMFSMVKCDVEKDSKIYSDFMSDKYKTLYDYKLQVYISGNNIKIKEYENKINELDLQLISKKIELQKLKNMCKSRSICDKCGEVLRYG